MSKPIEASGPVSWNRRKPKWDWQAYLTDEEREILQRIDKAKRRWQVLNRQRAGITNRALQRAKHAALGGKEK